LETELNSAPTEVRDYLREELSSLLKSQAAMEAIAAHLDPRISEERATVLVGRLRGFVAG
jgi:hypothetical protein